MVPTHNFPALVVKTSAGCFQVASTSVAFGTMWSEVKTGRMASWNGDLNPRLGRKQYDRNTSIVGQQFQRFQQLEITPIIQQPRGHEIHSWPLDTSPKQARLLWKISLVDGGGSFCFGWMGQDLHHIFSRFFWHVKMVILHDFTIKQVELR